MDCLKSCLYTVKREKECDSIQSKTNLKRVAAAAEILTLSIEFLLSRETKQWRIQVKTGTMEWHNYSRRVAKAGHQITEQ